MRKTANLPKVSILIICSILMLSSCEEDASLPEVITSLSEFSRTGATLVGNVTDDGGADITARGVCWSENESPIIYGDHTVDGSGTGSFTSTITGLSAGITYYARAYATNSVGTAYGNEISFTTDPASLASLTTNPVTSILSASAVSGGEISDDGGSEITARGVCWSTSEQPDINDQKTNDGTGTGSFTSQISGLEPDYTYYIRAYATNGAGTAYGNELIFYTDAIPPTISTLDVTDITSYSATSGGYAIDPADTPISSKGIWYGLNPNPFRHNESVTIEMGPGDADFSAEMTGLMLDTVYYVVAFATNASGTALGEVKSFRTDNVPAPIHFNNDVTYGSVTDIDGNTYRTVTIGTQTWMAENLKTTHYSDGTPIPLMDDENEWAYTNAEGYCWYLNDETNFKDVYGALYKQGAVITGQLCPAGWHVPSHNEWVVLVDYLGGHEVAGGKLKEAGTTHWIGSNEGASNETGFTALPGGKRFISATFADLGAIGSYWDGDNEMRGLMFTSNNATAWYAGFASGYGVSIRCIQD